MQGDPEFMVQTLMVGRGHEDKHYSVGNHSHSGHKRLLLELGGAKV